ncbi:hypothetical protein J0K78_04960 [Halobacillus sp. GSS1]|uniref:hypothetical protein n=1 Tax=Halobacillus sp. GSS1 TaxID=2815919 RepID=UPI001A8FEB63|nr:hypothetical protein [Halobacillus sp. GSS1]MBN9653610.1 hypothetical protein [Halobacillus sp. GSS1]
MEGMSLHLTKNGRKYFLDSGGEVSRIECSKCKQLNDVDSFYKSKNGFINRMSICKTCEKRYQQKRRAERKAGESGKSKQGVQVNYYNDVELFQRVQDVYSKGEVLSIKKQFDQFTEKLPIEGDYLLAIAYTDFLKKYSTE